MAYLLAGIVAVGAGCKADDPGANPGASDDLGGLVTARVAARDAPIDLARATSEPAELLRASQTGHGRIAQALGSHRVTSAATVSTRFRDREADTLVVHSKLAYRDDGDFHAVLDNSRDYGREIIHTAGWLYLAPRHGKFHRRRPETDQEPLALRDQAVAELGAHLELLATGIDVSLSGDGEHHGRRVRKVSIALSDSPREPAFERHAHRAWRKTIQVTAAKGEIWLDDQTGIPLRAELEGTLDAQRDGVAIRLVVALSFEVSDFDPGSEGPGEAIAITAPPEDRWVDTPLRSRELDERETLLRGIAPPAKRFEPGQPSSGQPSSGQPARKPKATQTDGANKGGAEQ